MQNIICSGWLLKTGGDGHNYKNTKRRWFELKGMYLFYFSEQPKEAKEMKVAKGLIYMPGCQVKVEEAEERIFLRTTGGKVYYLSIDANREGLDGVNDEISLKLKSWEKAMEYAMECARGVKDIKVAEGNWMNKRGGKSHGYVNWKKRRFMLKGNFLLYYSEDPELFDVFKYLKGFIDLASITAIEARENPADEVGKPFYFKLVIDNEREYFIAAQSVEQKSAWMKAIRQQTKMLAERLGYSNLRSIQKTEKVQVSGEMQRLHKSGHTLLKTYVVLTNLKLRYYASEADCDIHSFGTHMVGSIPLLGCGTQLLDDGTTITLHDLQGHIFTFVAKDAQGASNWMLSIRTASRSLIASVLSKNITISLNTYAFGKRGQDMGYTIAKLDAKALTILFLLLEKEKRLEWDEIDKVSLKDTKFTLNYTRRRTGVAKVIEFKSDNAIAFFDTISVIMSMREEIEAKERKRRAKGLTGNVDPAKAVRRTNSSQAIPMSPKMVQLRSSGNSNPTAASSSQNGVNAASSSSSPSNPASTLDTASNNDLGETSPTSPLKKAHSAPKPMKASSRPGSPTTPKNSGSTSPNSDSVPTSPSNGRVKIKTILSNDPKDSVASQAPDRAKSNKKPKEEEVQVSEEEVQEAQEPAQPKKSKKSNPVESTPIDSPKPSKSSKKEKTPKEAETSPSKSDENTKVTSSEEAAPSSHHSSKSSKSTKKRGSDVESEPLASSEAEKGKKSSKAEKSASAARHSSESGDHGAAENDDANTTTTTPSKPKKEAPS
jgi:hypothetical protein